MESGKWGRDIGNFVNVIAGATLRANSVDQSILQGILAAWDKADVVCLGEDHGSKLDSDLRIALKFGK